EKAYRVLGRLLEGEGTIDVRSTAVALAVVDDHRAAPGKSWEDLAERRLERRAASMQEHERRSGVPGLPVDLVVEVDPVDGRVALLGGAARGESPSEDESTDASGAADRRGPSRGRGSWSGHSMQTDETVLGIGTAGSLASQS